MVTSFPSVSVSLSLSLSLSPNVPHAQYRKRFRASYNYSSPLLGRKVTNNAARAGRFDRDLRSFAFVTRGEHFGLRSWWCHGRFKVQSPRSVHCVCCSSSKTSYPVRFYPIMMKPWRRRSRKRLHVPLPCRDLRQDPPWFEFFGHFWLFFAPWYRKGREASSVKCHKNFEGKVGQMCHRSCLLA